MEPDLRTLLREKAEEVRPDAPIPGPVLRRSRRRRAVTGVLAGALTVGSVAGVFVGARLLIEETASEPREVRPAGTPTGSYPFIYPKTQEQLNTTLSEVEQGSMPMWTDPSGAAALFAVNVLGWDPEDVMVDVRGDEPITAVITNPVLNEAAGATADLRTAVYIAQVPGSSDPPVYAVLAAQSEDMDVEPVGPDAEFGADGAIAFRGRLSFVPEGATVVLTVDGAEGATTVGPDGRFEVRAESPSGLGPSSVLAISVVDGSGRILAMTSSRLSTPVAGEAEGKASAPVEAGPPGEIPPAVLDTRQAILDAAQTRDYGALRALIPDRGFTFSYGGERDPIAYWKRLESNAHVPVFGDVIPRVLGTEPGLFDGIYIWPAQAGEDPSEWDQSDLEALSEIHLRQDIRLFQEIGLYTGWRVGIDRDGTWVFFVSGD